nr:MAG TPA: Repressor protein CI [Caudoviricetes sp.]
MKYFTEIGNRIKNKRVELNMTQEELALKSGYTSRSSINKIELGLVDIPQSKIASIATALDVSPAYLLFGDVFNNNNDNLELRPVNLKRFPMLGEIACGKPIFANEEHETYIDASADIKADFCLTAKGDSMVGARIHNGDVVFIKEQSIVDNGQIAAVIIDNDVTLKRWYFYPDKKKLVLQAENPSYEPFVFVGEELDNIRCLGRAVSFMSNL